MKIELYLGNDSYDIVLEKGVIKRAGEELDLARKVLVVTDSGVPVQYAECVASQCKDPVIVSVPMGEGSKSIEGFEKLLNAMLGNSFDRSSAVVAVGGGVVGDLSGFAASAFMRGIDFYNIPTTLLSQVDSSIGGKTAINLSGVKNIVGSFYQPKKVLVDPDVLDTLPKRELMEGLAEAIKMSVTSDEHLFDLIKNSKDLKADLPEIIKASLIIKRDVVEEDPFEHGKRKILNFGHTIGHGIEGYYKGRYLHGECVAMGMLYMADEPFKGELEEVLEKYDLPVRCDAGSEELMPFIKHDKKSGAGGITIVRSSKPGDYRLEKVSPDEIEEIIKAR
jgi:3-dehydroquinate synthase